MIYLSLEVNAEQITRQFEIESDAVCRARPGVCVRGTRNIVKLATAKRSPWDVSGALLGFDHPGSTRAKSKFCVPFFGALVVDLFSKIPKTRKKYHLGRTLVCLETRFLH